MSSTLNFTLVSEGASDRALIPVLRWVLNEHVTKRSAINGAWVDSDRLPAGKISPPYVRLRSAIEAYPCDLLFIHRDGDGAGLEKRTSEINEWLTEARLPNHVASALVIPVRMSEAWLLTDELAIRKASGNPNGRMPLNLPQLQSLEAVADPKAVLFETLLLASGLAGRKRKKFNRYEARFNVGSYISQMQILRKLTAFQRVENQIVSICHDRGWS